MTISQDAAQDLLSICKAVTIEETADRVWIVVNGEKIVGLEASSSKADVLAAVEVQRIAAVAAAGG
jgi:hypothetical protein